MSPPVMSTDVSPWDCMVTENVTWAGHRECRMVSTSAEWPVSPWYPNTPTDVCVLANSKVAATATIIKVGRKHRQYKTH